ncbi:unnamed protein product [Rhodiola kirilowii]
MTRVSREFVETVPMEGVPAVSADVVFATRRFPSYRIGANNEIIDVKDEPKISPLREAVARETALLLEQHKRLSVRDLAKKFERGLAFAAKQAEEDKQRDFASLEKHVILKKLRDSLESLNGRVVGKNKDDAEEAIALVEALAVQLTQNEVELIQEKVEVKKLANILKQASEDAKKIIEEERAFARSEIEKAKESVKRVEAAIQEQDRISEASGKQDMDKLMKEVQEARRIKMLHQPSKVMDMEHELQALRSQLVEKRKQSLQLQKELAMCRSRDKSLSQSHELDGLEALGSLLQIQSTSHTSPELSTSSAQWYHISRDSSKELISGATKSQYAPEPFDVGKTLLVEIISDGQLVTLTTTGPIDPAPGLGSYVESLMRKNDTEFKVVISQMNGQHYTSDSIHLLHVGKMRIKLRKGKSTIVKENYTSAMQLCGVRGGGDAAPQAAFWQPKKGLNFILVFESDRDRNAAIMLSRRFAFDCNIVLAGPGDRSNST